MTALASRSSPPVAAGPVAAPATTLLVQIIALFSLVTGGYQRWVEFRFVEPRQLLLPDALPGIWAWPAGATPQIPDLSWLALPIYSLLYLWTASVFAHYMLLRLGRARQARYMLLPTVLLIGLLVWNSVYFYRLLALGRLDSFQVPITAYAAVLLGVWVISNLRRPRLAGAVLRRVRRILRVLFILLSGAFAVWFFGFAFVGSPAPARVPGDRPRLAVVLGNYVRPDGRTGQLLTDRTLTAIDLYRQGQVQKILLSGAMAGQDGNGPDEPAAMKRLCMAAGIPEAAIYLDPVGINRRATVEGTRQLVAQLGGAEVVAVSSGVHLPRLGLSFRQAGMKVFTVTAAPTVWGPEDLPGTVKEIYATLVYAFDPSYRPAQGVAMGITHPRVVVSKSAGTLDLYDGTRLVRTYPCITGLAAGDKDVEGDKKTPLGTFRIVYKNPESKYHLSMGLDYPNTEDVARGLAAGVITPAQAADVLDAAKSDLRVESNQNRLWKSPLGGEIFIHGHGEGRPGTAGCIALSNPLIEELYAVCEVGTEVEIRP